MKQQSAAITARQLLWTYWGTADEVIEKEFYLTLQGAVATSIRERFHETGRIWVGRELQVQVGSYVLHTRLTNMDPPLATLFDASTEFIARFRERTPEEGQDVSAFLAEIIRYPEPSAGATYDSLVGLDAIKEQLERNLGFLLRPRRIENWVQTVYGANAPEQLLQVLRDRYPLIILEGEVGSGKTAMARSIGDILANTIRRPIALFVVNAQIRGGGHVGELTQNISRAFDEAERCQQREQIPVMILIDEADALAQTRGTRQTHHEDDAGVNTLIQRIDRLRGRPMAVIFASNLFQSLDSAILRRASATFHFDRPDFARRVEVFQTLLGPVGIDDVGCSKLAIRTEPRGIPGLEKKYHRYTYSDLTQRIIPYAVENAVEQRRALDIELLVSACAKISPTPEYAQTQPEQQPHFEDYFGRQSAPRFVEENNKDTSPMTHI